MLFSTISCVGVYRSTESDNTPVVFAHQSKWQQDMMRLYGEYIWCAAVYSKILIANEILRLLLKEL